MKDQLPGRMGQIGHMFSRQIEGKTLDRCSEIDMRPMTGEVIEKLLPQFAIIAHNCLLCSPILNHCVGLVARCQATL
ncbi:hypothetical protein ES707_07321 [subsurface metagenome]